jgi:hypothetical protein
LTFCPESKPLSYSISYLPVWEYEVIAFWNPTLSTQNVHDGISINLGIASKKPIVIIFVAFIKGAIDIDGLVGTDLIPFGLLDPETINASNIGDEVVQIIAIDLDIFGDTTFE